MRLFILLAVIGAFLPVDLEAYELWPYRWSDNCFTHDGRTEVTYALAEWGAYGNVKDCGPGSEITTEIDPGLPSLGIATCDVSGVVYHCHIKVHPDATQVTWTHEVGHALMLGHSSVVTAMMHEWCCNAIVQDDIDGIRALYGPPHPETFYKTYMPQVMK